MEDFEHTEERMFSRIIDDLEGVLSANEKAELQKWRSTSVENEALYSELYEINQRMGVIRARERADADRSWISLEKKLDKSDDHTGVNDSVWRNKNLFRWVSGIAATIVFSLASYSYFFGHDMVTITTSAKVKKVILSDGTRVILNRNTVICYDKSNFSSNRVLVLRQGEAFFTVKRDPMHAFSLDLGEVRAVDLGTSFNALRSGNDVSVIVESGRVAVAHGVSGQSVILNPGMKATYVSAQKMIADTPNVNPNYKSWSDKKLVFVNAPLPYVVHQLEKTYSTKVGIQGTLTKRRITASFHYETIDSALVILSSSLGCKYKKLNNRYLLTPVP